MLYILYYIRYITHFNQQWNCNIELNTILHFHCWWKSTSLQQYQGLSPNVYTHTTPNTEDVPVVFLAWSHYMCLQAGWSERLMYSMLMLPVAHFTQAFCISPQPLPGTFRPQDWTLSRQSAQKHHNCLLFSRLNCVSKAGVHKQWCTRSTLQTFSFTNRVMEQWT